MFEIDALKLNMIENEKVLAETTNDSHGKYHQHVLSIIFAKRECSIHCYNNRMSAEDMLLCYALLQNLLRRPENNSQVEVIYSWQHYV